MVGINIMQQRIVIIVQVIRLSSYWSILFKKIRIFQLLDFD